MSDFGAPGAFSMEAASIHLRLAAAHRNAGRLTEAHKAYVHALEITEEILGPDDVGLAAIFCDLAEIELARGRFSTGEPYARRSLEICHAAGIEEITGSRTVLAALLAGQRGVVEPES